MDHADEFLSDLGWKRIGEWVKCDDYDEKDFCFNYTATFAQSRTLLPIEYSEEKARRVWERDCKRWERLKDAETNAGKPKDEQFFGKSIIEIEMERMKNAGKPAEGDE